mmetsp:Transcript_11240/g.24197  ORF Transcript_11240/g.24197 Transcript_11240/m.24197 type:complete len:262 (-) Transcript_11240:163-948(-)
MLSVDSMLVVASVNRTVATCSCWVASDVPNFEDFDSASESWAASATDTARSAATFCASPRSDDSSARDAPPRNTISHLSHFEGAISALFFSSSASPSCMILISVRRCSLGSKAPRLVLAAPTPEIVVSAPAGVLFSVETKGSGTRVRHEFMPSTTAASTKRAVSGTYPEKHAAIRFSASCTRDGRLCSNKDLSRPSLASSPSKGTYSLSLARMYDHEYVPESCDTRELGPLLTIPFASRFDALDCAGNDTVSAGGCCSCFC